ncbi:MAG TPA: hypothetical protein VF190_11740 [Rhodothermales bacterium]
MQKRGGTSYAGPAMTAATYARAVVYADFPSGSQLVAVGNNGHVYTVTSGTTTDLGGTTINGWADKPKLRVGGGKNLLIFTDAAAGIGPVKYDGSAAQTALGGSPPAAIHSEIYKSRLVLGNTSANPNRLYFSPTPDIESTWDTTNSWIDCDHAITGIAALRNALLIFSQGHIERIIGTTPPPGSDMDRSPLGDVGTPDARSIVVQEGNCLFANPRGVYLTNGSGFASLTTEGQIESYWQSLFSSYDPSSWVISAGILRSFYFITIYDGTNYTTLMCNVPRRAWWRLSNVKAHMFAQAVGTQDELYYADGGTNRVTKLSGIFSPSSSNKNDADGTAVTPTATLRTYGEGPGLKAFGDGHLTYDMRDAATDNPTLAVQIATGAEATTFSSVTESPLAETSDATRTRFSTGKDSQAITVKLTQSNASSKTEIYAVELDQRPYPMGNEGQ